MLVAVSGGADSTALLVALASLRGELGLELTAAHLHHGLRGAEADGDLAFVRAMCVRLSVPLIAARWNCRARMARAGLTGQAGLRTLRRRFLRQAMRRADAIAIVTAHTADDQLETLLMRLGRGTGLAGAAGMAPRRGVWLKPMLDVSRRALARDLEAAGLGWREDASNAGGAYLRSRIRHVAVPALARALWPAGESSRAREILAHHAVALCDDARSARHALLASNHVNLRGLCRIHSGMAFLDSRRLASYPDVVQAAGLDRVWRSLGGSVGLTRRHRAAWLQAVRSPRARAQVALPGGWRAERHGAQWVIRAVPRGVMPAVARPATLAVPGRVERDGTAVRSRWVSGDAARRGLFTRPGVTEYFAASELRGALQLRAAEVDETFVPFGRSHPARLRDFMRRQRVREPLRRRPTVLADAGGILWVVGVRRAERARISPATRRALRVHAERS
ncbi:MAG TPA: tRNA lysidine(34) synthetase TilS [Candidatus Eisenbacteria bacterium]|nr:tRNA lysidine(34) synthetase TilS [Candidatus Eisenbacteria bacterium]